MLPVPLVPEAVHSCVLPGSLLSRLTAELLAALDVAHELLELECAIEISSIQLIFVVCSICHLGLQAISITDAVNVHWAERRTP